MSSPITTFIPIVASPAHHRLTLNQIGINDAIIIIDQPAIASLLATTMWSICAIR